MAFPTDSFEELKITNTRERSDTANLLPDNFDPYDTETPERPRPEARVDLYTRTRLQQGLVYAEKTLRWENVSSRAELFLAYYKQSIKDALTAETTHDREDHIKDVLIEENLIPYSVCLSAIRPKNRPECAGQVEFEDRLLKLRELQYILRYGEYLEIKPAKIKIDTNTQRTGNWELSLGEHEWTKMADAMIKEDKHPYGFSIRRTCGESPTRFECGYACRYLGLCIRPIIWSIKQYATGNEQHHPTLQTLIERGDLYVIAENLHADLNDIESVISYNSSTDTEHLRAIIQAEIEHYFWDTNRYPDMNPQAWSRSKALQDTVDAIYEKARETSINDEDKSGDIPAASGSSPSALAPPWAGTKERLAKVTKPTGSLSPFEQMKTQIGRIDRLASKTKLEDEVADLRERLAHILQEEIEEGDDDHLDDYLSEDSEDDSNKIQDDDDDVEEEADDFESRRSRLLAKIHKIERRAVRARQELMRLEMEERKQWSDCLTDL